MFHRRSLLPILLVFLALAGCSKRESGSVPPAESTPVSVTVMSPQRKTLRWTIEQPGAIVAYEQTPLVAKLPGFVKKIYVDIDDKVTGPQSNWWGNKERAGTLLAEIAIKELEEEFNQKEAMKIQARAEVRLAEQNYEVAKANLIVAKQLIVEMKAGEDRAEASYKRWMSETARVDELVRKMVIDKQTADETRNQAVSAKSALDESRARTLSADAGKLESEAKMKRSKIEIDAALARQTGAEADSLRLEAMKQYMQIRAPYDGIVTARHLDTGRFVQSAGIQAEPIFTVARIDPVRVVVNVPEAAASLINKGSKLSIRIQSLRNAEFAGTVARTSWALNPDVRTLRVEIDLPNPDGRIRPGFYAYTSIPVELSNVLVVPNSAVFYQDEQAFCYFVDDDKSVRYQVQTGQRDAENIEIQRKKRGRETWRSLDGKEAVVIANEGPLADGQSVRVK